MWKIPVFTMMLATMFLGGCNWGNNASEETPMEDVQEDVRRGVDDVEDAVDPNRNDDTYDRNVNGEDQGTVSDTVIPPAINPDVEVKDNVPNGNNNLPNGDTNGANGTNGVNNEDVIEDNADVRDRDNVDNR